MFVCRQFGDVNPNSIESSYYERTINATFSNGADHINGEHHVYSLFYGMSNAPVNHSRKNKIRFFISVYYKLTFACRNEF